MKIAKYIWLWGALAAMPIMSGAQTHVTFESADFSSIGVYDTWEESPFRTNQLAGNVALVNNHLADDDTNSSQKILGVQRSRFGSNTFGARINLNQSFELTPTLRYVHVMIHKPVDGRVMLIGLGKRTDRDDQTPDVEQFWSYPINDVKTGEWFDAVFPIKGNGGIEIHSLVVVPHCESPHILDGDFVAYIDDILLDDNMKPRVGAGDYPLSFTVDTPHGRANERWTSTVGLQGSSDGNQSITIPTTPAKMAYYQLFDTPLKAKAGNNVTATFGYNSGWMHSYVYLDKGNDGEFSASVDANLNLDTSTDLMAYTLYSNGQSTGKNSAGTTIRDTNNGFNLSSTPPAFTIPSNLANGFYRMRYKIDWNNIDAGGDVESFITNGGIIVDVMLNVHGDYCNVTNDNRNGEVTTASGESLNGYRAPFGQQFKVKMVPANGFEYNGIRVRHGYNLSGDSLVHGNPQYRDEIIYADEFDGDDCVNIPAEYMDGDVLIEGLFVEEGKGDGRVKVTYNVVCNDEVIKSKTIKVTPGSAFPDPEFTSEVPSYYYSLSAKPDGVCTADTVVELALTNNLPFKPSSDFEHARWYHLTISAAHNYLIHGSGSYINIGTTTTATPAEDNLNAQWAFVGNVFDGFKIVNRGAGDGKILSSSTNTSSNTGGSTYPIMTSEPVPSGNNTAWIPTRSTYLTGETGFFLSQMGIEANAMNKRDDKLAYWTGGADAGSTFACTELSGYALTIVAPASNQGTITVMEGSTQLASGARVEEGTELTIIVTPLEYFNIVEVTVNGNPIEAVDGVYKFVMGAEAATVAATFERDPNAPIEYCVPVYGGTASSRTTTSRTDRHLDTMTVTDGENTITVQTGGSSNGRQVYVDRTNSVLVTTPGSTVTVTTGGAMWAMHNFIYADFDRTGFDSNDRVVYSEEALGNFTFTVPSDLKPGDYRIRHMVDWSNTDPCQFAMGESGDNAESVIDFLIRIEGSVLSIVVDGQGEVEVWSEGSISDGPAGTRYENGDVLPADGLTPYIFANPAEGWSLGTITYDAGNGTPSDCALEQVSSLVENYGQWYLAQNLPESEGDAVISVTFIDDTLGIDTIGLDPANGPIEYYNLQGVRVASDNLTPGFYVARQGDNVVKILVK